MFVYQVHPYIMLKEFITFSVEIETLRFISDIKKIFFFSFSFLYFCLKNIFIFFCYIIIFVSLCVWETKFYCFLNGFFAKFKNTFQFRMSERMRVEILKRTVKWLSVEINSAISFNVRLLRLVNFNLRIWYAYQCKWLLFMGWNIVIF